MREMIELMKRYMLVSVTMLSVVGCMTVMMATSASATAPLPFDTVKARLDMQRYVYPQEKIHVTTDQSQYVAGDTIWLRAWLVDAATHQQVSASKYVYVELLNPFGDVEKRVKIREEDGAYIGYLPLETEMAEGDYTLAAYTMFMESPGSDYFFRKRIGVVSPYSAQADIKTDITPVDNDEALALQLSFQDLQGNPMHYEKMIVKTKSGKELEGGRGDRTRNFKIKRKDAEGRVVLLQLDNYKKYLVLPPPAGLLDVTFHPEGGYLIPGVPCKVGFKAIDGGGRGVDIKGVLKDSKGETVTEFATIHAGLGTLLFIPQPGETYTAEVDGHSFTLPESRADAAVLHVDNSRPENIKISAVGAVPQGAQIIISNRGMARYSSAIEPGKIIQLPSASLGEGVMQILLLTEDLKPLSERLVFVYPEEPLDGGLTAKME